jgi:hypothetical protein
MTAEELDTGLVEMRCGDDSSGDVIHFLRETELDRDDDRLCVRAEDILKCHVYLIGIHYSARDCSACLYISSRRRALQHA